MTLTPLIKSGQRYTLNGITIDVHMIRGGQVCYRIWPKHAKEMGFLDNLYRTELNDFVTCIMKDKPALEKRA